MHTILITFHVLAMLLHSASKPVIFTHLPDETRTHSPRTTSEDNCSSLWACLICRVKPNSHRRRNETVEFRRVDRCEWSRRQSAGILNNLKLTSMQTFMRTASAWYTHIYLLRVLTSSTDCYTIGYMSLTENLDTHHVQNKAINDSRLPPGATCMASHGE